MEQRVTKIEFSLENCEVIEADILNCWHTVQVGKCYKSYNTQSSCDGHGARFFEQESTDYCRLQFELKDFHPKNTNFAGNDNEVPTESESYNRLIKGRDVTSIVLIFNDGTEKQIYIPWEGDGFYNKVQYSFVRKAYKDEKILEIHFDYHYYWHKFIFWLYLRKIRIEQYFRNKKHFKRITKELKEYGNQKV